MTKNGPASVNAPGVDQPNGEIVHERFYVFRNIVKFNHTSNTVVTNLIPMNLGQPDRWDNSDFWGNGPVAKESLPWDTKAYKILNPPRSMELPVCSKTDRPVVIVSIQEVHLPHVRGMQINEPRTNDGILAVDLETTLRSIGDYLATSKLYRSYATDGDGTRRCSVLLGAMCAKQSADKEQMAARQETDIRNADRIRQIILQGSKIAANASFYARRALEIADGHGDDRYRKLITIEGEYCDLMIALWVADEKNERFIGDNIQHNLACVPQLNDDWFVVGNWTDNDGVALPLEIRRYQTVDAYLGVNRGSLYIVVTAVTRLERAWPSSGECAPSEDFGQITMWVHENPNHPPMDGVLISRWSGGRAFRNFEDAKRYAEARSERAAAQ